MTSSDPVVPEVGPWAKRKYHFLSRYLNLFSTGMKNSWEHRIYIDLFSGAGKARVVGKNEIVNTSAMIAATVRDPFTHLHLCERDPKKLGQLKRFIENEAHQARCTFWNGDANQEIDSILDRIPLRKTLCIAFVDPFGLHFDFATASKLAQRKTDLIILLADRMDALRNWQAYYLNNPDSTFDRFMGESGWRDDFMNANSEQFVERLQLRYQSRLQSIGYKYFDYVRIAKQSGIDLYKLVFASKNPKGLEFWQKAKSVDEQGQRELFGS